jgi:hypothetical protein
VLTNGKIINIKAEEVEWHESVRMIKLINKRHIVARINMDNVVGWIETDYCKAESEEEGQASKEELQWFDIA